MKTRLLQVWRMAAGVLAVPLFAGCVEDSTAESSQISASTHSVVATAPAVAAAVDESPAVEVVENASSPGRAEPAPGSAAAPAPPDLKLSPATREIVKLAQGGVDSSVLLAFVTNSTGTFMLGSDQIVYLNDLGVASEVIASMIEHDRLLREGQGTLPPVAVAAAPPPPPPATFDVSTAAPQPLPEAQEATAAPPPQPVAEAVPAPPTSVTYNYFYDSLSPYGTWVDVEGYGYCWQPTMVVANPGWQPYCNGGRWIYSDYGWYWHSDYSWGWAPFHYGRWFTHPRWGWCWYPDTVWGPSWVSWRYTDAHCGWAPLPPAAHYTAGLGFSYYGSSVGVSFGFGLGWNCYSYVPWTHFHGQHGHHYEKHRRPPHHAREIHEHSRVANDFVAGKHNTPVNRGVGEERVRQYTKSELRPVRVREEAVSGHEAFRNAGGRLERGGRELVIRRPPIPQTPAESKLAKGARPEGRTATTIPQAERRSPLEPRDPRGPTPARTAGAVPDGPQRGKPVAPAGNLTRQEPPVPDAVREGNPRPPTGSPSRPSPEVARRSPSPGPVSPPPAPTTPRRVESPQTKREAPSSGTVTHIGRRDAAPSPPANAPSTGSVARNPQPPSQANATASWTRPSENRANVALNNPQRAPVPTPPAAQAPTPTAQRPSTPISSGTVRRESPPRIQAAPAPSVRSEPRLSAPPAPVSPPNVVRFPSTPSPGAPPVRSSPGPSPNFAPRPAPAPTPAAPPPRSSPGPSFSPAPAPSAPSAAPAPSAPRSAPSSPPSNSGSSGRAGGGRPTQPR
jgi:hypothetical protein